MGIPAIPVLFLLVLCTIFIVIVLSGNIKSGLSQEDITGLPPVRENRESPPVGLPPNDGVEPLRERTLKVVFDDMWVHTSHDDWGPGEWKLGASVNGREIILICSNGIDGDEIVRWPNDDAMTNYIMAQVPVDGNLRIGVFGYEADGSEFDGRGCSPHDGPHLDFWNSDDTIGTINLDVPVRDISLVCPDRPTSPFDVGGVYGPRSTCY